MYTFDEKIVSDLHKDARGYRPDAYFWEEWSQTGDDTRQAMWDGLLEELAVELDREAADKTRATKAFWGDMRQARHLGAKDDVAAIRWIIEGSKISKTDLAYGADYVAFHFGLGYDNTFKRDIQAAIDSMNIDFDLLYSTAD